MAESVATSSQEDSRPTTPAREANRIPAYHFQWDLDSRRKGPGSVVSEATESRTGAPEPPSSRTEVFFENATSGSATPSFPTSWSASTQGFNAISTVLNNPRTKPNPLKASKAPQPPAHSPELKRIRRKDFDPYLKTIGPAWQKFEQARKEALDPAGTPGAMLSPGSEQHDQSHPAVPILSDPSDSTSNSRPVLSPLSSVPAVYFNSSFDLSDPRVFATVTEQDTGAFQQTSSSPTDIALNHILQEKMSHYMDVVEQHLVREIAIRSAPFFAALSNLQDLQTEGAACLSRIARLKAQLHEVDNCQARRGLHVIHLQAKRDNLQQLQRAVKSVREVTEMSTMAKHLDDEGDHFAALGLAENIETLLERKDELQHPSANSPRARPRLPSHHTAQPSESIFSLPTVIESPDAPTNTFGKVDLAPPASQRPVSLVSPELSVDLTLLSSLSELPSKLSDLKRKISSALQKDLLALLTEDLVAQTTNLEPDSQVGTSDSTLRSEAWTAQLRIILDGLLRTNGIEEGFAAYKNSALSQIKMLFQAHQVSIAESSIQGSEIDGEDNVDLVKNMEHDDFMRLLRSLYKTLLKSIRTTQEHGALVQKELQELHEQNPKYPSTDNLTEEYSAAVFAVAELASSCAARLLNARADQHVTLPWASFLELYNETSTFNVNSEILCRTMIIALRGAANSQAKAYLSAFHAQRISESAKLVEEETWTAVDVPPKSQRLVLALIEAAVSNPPEILVQPSTNITSNGEAESIGTLPKYITIEDQQYHVVGATLQAIRLLVDYLSIIANLPLLTIDVMPKIIEFLKAFNSRTCQVVLGAGALRSAGLKNITARHLALASQSLTVMVTLIPYVRETFRRHLNPKQAVMLIEFDKLKRDFQEHQNEIYAKLISIMGDRLAEIDWATPSSKPPPNGYMEVLVKETATLHKVLTRYLSAHASELIMSQVFAAINHRLSEEYTKIDLPNQPAKDRLLEDAKYLHARLSALPGVGGLSSMLETVVLDKRLVLPAPPEPVQSPIQAAPVPPSKPARRTLSSIFGKDSKRTPVPTPAPEKTEVPGPPPAEETSKLSALMLPIANEAGSAISHVDADPVPEERPGGQSTVEEASVAPTEAMHSEETHVSNGTVPRDTIATPGGSIHADSAAGSHPNSPTGGDQQLSVEVATP
ncbi:vacuolar protein sorting-associated protein 54 [Ceratobasidium sp. AG-Ba]|nr:vacuolar protein sorting-associated protein 54 [Ceratobasidium sp. AG-Ba]